MMRLLRSIFPFLPIFRKLALALGKHFRRHSFNRKPAMLILATTTLTKIVALKNRNFARLVANGARIVQRFSFGAVILAAIHERTGWRVARFVAVKLFKLRVKLHQHLLMVVQAYLKLNIRTLRIQYLLLKIDEGGFDLDFVLDLRKVEKAWERGCFVGQPPR